MLAQRRRNSVGVSLVARDHGVSHCARESGTNLGDSGDVCGLSRSGGTTRGSGTAPRGRMGVPTAPPGVPGYIGIGRAYGSCGMPLGEGTYRPSRSYCAEAEPSTATKAARVAATSAITTFGVMLSALTRQVQILVNGHPQQMNKGNQSGKTRELGGGPSHKLQRAAAACCGASIRNWHYADQAVDGRMTSAFGGKADVDRLPMSRQLLTQPRHSA